jgi:hypothetical protein
MITQKGRFILLFLASCLMTSTLYAGDYKTFEVDPSGVSEDGGFDQPEGDKSSICQHPWCKKVPLGLILFMKTSLDIAVVYLAFHQQEMTGSVKNQLDSLVCCPEDTICLNNKQNLIYLGSLAYGTNFAITFFSAGAIGIDIGAIAQYIGNIKTNMTVCSYLRTTIPTMAFLASTASLICGLGANSALWKGARNNVENIPTPIVDDLGQAITGGFYLVASDLASVAPALGLGCYLLGAYYRS